MSDDALLWARKQVASQYRGSSTLTAAILSGEHDDQSPVHDYASAYRAGHAAAQSEAEARVAQLEAENARLREAIAVAAVWTAVPGTTIAEIRAALEGRQP